MKLLPLALFTLARAAPTLLGLHNMSFVTELLHPETEEYVSFCHFLLRYKVDLEIDHYLTRIGYFHHLSGKVSNGGRDINVFTDPTCLAKHQSLRQLVALMIFRTVKHLLQDAEHEAPFEDLRLENARREARLDAALQTWRNLLDGQNQIHLNLEGVNWICFWTWEVSLVLNGSPNFTSVSFAHPYIILGSFVQCLELKYAKRLNLTGCQLTFLVLPKSCDALKEVIFKNNRIRSINLSAGTRPQILHIDLSGNPMVEVNHTLDQIFPNAQLTLSLAHLKKCRYSRKEGRGSCSCYVNLPRGECNRTCGVGGWPGCKCSYTEIVNLKDESWRMYMKLLNVEVMYKFVAFVPYQWDPE